MAPTSNDDVLITLSCTNPTLTETDSEKFISVADIHSWDPLTILRYRTVNIIAHRNRLVDQSTYFHGLLSGSFSESNLDHVSIEWNFEVFLNVVKFMHGSSVDVTSKSFLSLLEAALYFGVETLLAECKNWFSEMCSSKERTPVEMNLEDFICIWNFGVEHAIRFLPELCSSYLAKNFMWATHSKYFVDVPHHLLSSCIKHPNLTVYSEKHLSDAILVWLNANTEQSEPSNKVEDECTDILRQVRFSLLPLWFAAGKRRHHIFSELANKSIQKIFRLLNMSPTSLIDLLREGCLDNLKIRLTEYSKKLDLSSCPQITSAILLLSLLPTSYTTDDSKWKSIKKFLIHFERKGLDQSGISQDLLPILSFEVVQEVDISGCPRLHLESAICFFSKAFPLLRKLRAKHLLNFTPKTLYKLVQACSHVNEVDLTVDVTPLVPSQVSVISSSPGTIPMVHSISLTDNYYSFNPISCNLEQPTSNITSLTLEGRGDICDSDLLSVAKLCVSIQYLNLRGCISVTDIGISNLIGRCINLHSILVCNTSFGRNSILTLCSATTNLSASSTHFQGTYSSTLASKLEKLHIGDCHGVDKGSMVELLSQAQTLKSLCLRGICLTDDALYSFPGSSLETLDVSNTTVSGAALAHIFRGNCSLKCLNVRGCKNLVQQASSVSRMEHSSLYFSRELFVELGNKCMIEEIELGWGFSCLYLEALRPAIMSLKAITVGLGGSFSEDALSALPSFCPMMESITLYFQVISDCILTNFLYLRHLKVLALCYCRGDISFSSFKFFMPSLRKLRLERVTPQMANNDLVTLVDNCVNLVGLSLIGCRLLNSDSLQIISHGWPGLISMHLEDCGNITADGVSSLFSCQALEDLLLRHNGPGLCKSFVLDAASKMPMLRQLSLDMCDAREGDFDIPDYDNRYFLRTVKIARCKRQRCPSNVDTNEYGRRLVHKETLVLVWNSENLIKTVVKERL